MWTRIFPVDFVDHDNWLGAVFQRLAQDKTSLRLRTIVRVDDKKHAIHHFHDALDFAAEISVARCIDDINTVTVPLEGGVLCPNGDSLFPLEIHRVHHTLFHLLVGAKRARLSQQLIDEGRLAVIDVRDDRDIADLIHMRARL